MELLRPELVVLNEPVSALDLSIRAQIINLLLDLKERLRLTFLMISHDLGAVEHMSDRVAVGRFMATRPAARTRSGVSSKIVASARSASSLEKVTFVPVTNRKGTREGDRNLNRDLYDKPVPRNYEDTLGNRICAMLRQHDVLLDVHSFQGEGEPFVFFGPEDNAGALEPFRHGAAETAFAACLGTSVVIHGWLDNYARLLGTGLAWAAKAIAVATARRNTCGSAADTGRRWNAEGMTTRPRSR